MEKNLQYNPTRTYRQLKWSIDKETDFLAELVVVWLSPISKQKKKKIQWQPRKPKRKLIIREIRGKKTN